jgi:hypothetical protein
MSPLLVTYDLRAPGRNYLSLWLVNPACGGLSRGDLCQTSANLGVPKFVHAPIA